MALISASQSSKERRTFEFEWKEEGWITPYLPKVAAELLLVPS